jgi:pimeloyl-ACP methyl ester carboxylesterase
MGNIGDVMVKFKFSGAFAFIGLLMAMTGVACAAPVQETISVKRLDDSVITAYISHDPNFPKQSVLLVLQGSNCESVAPIGGTDQLPRLGDADMAQMSIEKYALSPANTGANKAQCPADYLAHNSIDQRLQDVLSAMNYLRYQAPWWNGRLYLMGTSEGATVAAVSGTLIPETRGIILINGSIGRPFRDGWADAMAASVGGDKAAEAEVRAEAAKTWDKARHNPTPDEEAFGKGNTLLWWRSIIDIRPSNLLIQIPTPILLLQSDHDEMTPIASARAVEAQFKAVGKSNLSYVELKGLTHGLRTLDGKPAWAPVLKQVTDWLKQQDATAH